MRVLPVDGRGLWSPVDRETRRSRESEGGPPGPGWLSFAFSTTLILGRVVSVTDIEVAKGSYRSAPRCHRACSGSTPRLHRAASAYWSIETMMACTWWKQ